MIFGITAETIIGYGFIAVAIFAFLVAIVGCMMARDDDSFLR